MKDTTACGDCVVSVLLGGGPVAMDDSEEEAVANLAAVGLIPALRLVPDERRVG